MKLGKTIRLFGGFVLLATSACSGIAVDDESATGYEEFGASTRALVGCSLSNAVPLQGPNVSNRLGSNACVAVIHQILPPWWHYSDGTLRVQIANFDSRDPNENAFPLPVEWENTCGTEQGSAIYTLPWQQHELGHPSAQPSQCSIVIKLGGESTQDVLIFWGA